ncbi:hypothetical protein HZA56_14700 [Candidatus Poribacteria bacterium]|nr:hypothetical protein [Candidatus Poribacteria bacterium]
MIELAKRKLLPVAISLVLCGCSSIPWGTKAERKAISEDNAERDAISQVKLTADSLPQGMKITRETRASTSQVRNARVRIGFPLVALVNQSITYGQEQAKVNYMVPAGDEWLDFGYSKLVATDADKSLVITKNGVIVQLAATKKDLENKLARMLEPDPAHLLKIRADSLPGEWTLTGERYLPRREVAALEQKYGVRIQGIILQEFIVNRERAMLQYYSCESEDAAHYLSRRLATADTNSSLKRKVKSSESVVVVAESQDKQILNNILSQVNW